MIPPEKIEQIREQSDIVKIISEYVTLRKRGKNYLGLCPFHSEKDASFTVSPDKQIFHCFGCKAGGNVFSFIMNIENISFIEAVAELGNKLGVDLPEIGQATVKRGEKEKLYKAMDLAASFFRESLNQPVKEYLAKRKISEQTIKDFSLGFAPDGWDNLFKHLIARGVAPETMAKVGLILPRENTSGYYDRFRNRLVFAIKDHRGRIVAFGGRALGNDEPKYLNSADTYIYQKGEVLYGLNLAKNSIKESKTAILVEGYFDLITPFQAGITNMAAALGTALTVEQCKLLSRYCETVILAFDADAAGGLAAERSAELLRAQGLKVKVAKLTGGKDPDEIISKHGQEAFVTICQQALPYLEFKLNVALAKHNITEIEGRSRALRDAALILGQEQNEFVQKEYAKAVAGQLKTDLETVLEEIKRHKHYQDSTKSLKRQTEKPQSKIIEAEKNLIALASQNSGVIKTLKERLVPDDFTLPESRDIIGVLMANEQTPENPAHFLLEHLVNEQSQKFLAGLLVSQETNETEEQILNDCLQVIKEEQRQKRLRALKLEISSAEKAGQTQKVSELLMSLKSEIS
ncbi:MAG: DNA primase [bacterium]